MKKIILIITCVLTICGLQVQAKDSTYQVSSSGRTPILNKRYHVRAWIETIRLKGDILKFVSDVPFAKAVLKRWKKDGQGQLVSDSQTITFNPNVKSFDFIMDSPAYKGSLMYDLLLYVNTSDLENDYAWRIHLVKQ